MNKKVTALALLVAALLSAPALASRNPKLSDNGYWLPTGKPLKGKVKIVEHNADIKIKAVNNFPDIKVKSVSNFPNNIGEWQFVDNFPDFTVQYVENFEDLKVQFVDNFPGVVK